jgi:hypothetical protein
MYGMGARVADYAQGGQVKSLLRQAKRASGLLEEDDETQGAPPSAMPQVMGTPAFNPSAPDPRQSPLLAQDADHAHRGGIRGGIRHLLGTDRLSPEVSALLDPDQKKRALEMGTFQQFMLGGVQGVANNMIGLATKRKEMDTAARQESDFRRIRDTAAKMPMGPERSEYVARAMAEVIDNPVNAMQTAVGLREREFAPRAPVKPITKNTENGIMQYNLATDQWEPMRDAEGRALMAPPVQAPPNQILPSINPDGTPGYTAVSGRGGEVKVTPVEDVVRPDASGRTTAAVRAQVASNRAQLSVIDEALAELEKYPDAVGLSRMAGEAINQRVDPRGIAARQALSNVGSLRVHDRSGAAVTASEFPRLRPFIPNVSDTYQKNKSNLEAMRRELESETAELERGTPAQAAPTPKTPAGLRKTALPKPAHATPAEWAAFLLTRGEQP